MLKDFKNFIEHNGLINKGEKVLLAISGGVDSMVLAKLMIEGGYRISLAHCNFHLRGEDSNRDENFVRRFADSNALELFVKEFDTETFAAENSLSIEMAARQLRYSWFEELKKENNFDKVAVAHHSDDQIETFFINLLRGSGIKGLKAMKAVNGFYIRPLLWTNRKMIETYAKENGIAWVEDYTNAETNYLRNKIRHNIIPAFDEIKNNARQSLNFSINCLSAENDLFRNLIEEKLSDIEYVNGDYRSIDNVFFTKNESGKQFLFEWLRRYDFNYGQCESMYEAMMQAKSGTLFYSKEYCVSVQNNKVEIFKNESDKEEYLVEKAQTDIKIPFSMKMKCVDNDDNFILVKNPSLTAQFDMDKIKFPLKIRRWKQGDRFKPLGMKGSKLLSDFFNDLNFSTFQKQNVWIMEDADATILWVVGHRISDKVRIISSTKHIFQCDIVI